MTWVVDIGNSSINWGPYRDGDVGKTRSFYRTDLGIAEDLDGIWGSETSPESLVCSCVAGEEIEQAFVKWCELVWGIKPIMIRPAAQAFGVKNAYLQCERLGADRWSGLVAVHRMLGEASCIVSCGTAMTIDVIEEGGQHLGGLIMPGRRLMRESLSHGTAMTVGESEGDNTTLFARNTADAINGGALYAMVATLDRIYDDVDQALGSPVRRVITGGDAADVLPLLKGEIMHYPNLVLQGLAIIHKHNEAPPS